MLCFRYNIKGSTCINHPFLTCLSFCLLVFLLGVVPDGGEGVGVPNSTKKNTVRVLLVSSTVRKAGVLAAAARDDVLVIEYDAKATTLEDLLGDIRSSLGGRRAISIGIAAHDYGDAKFYLCGTETICLGTTLSSEEQSAFWKGLASTLASGGRIDLFACNLARGAMGMRLVSALEEVAGVNFAASINNTGGLASGGDWTLETDEIDIAELYFAPTKLANFTGLLASEFKKLTASDAAADDSFGWSVSVSGDYAIVGTKPYGQPGSAYIFYRNHGGTNNWGQLKKLTPSDGGPWDKFGYSVSISGDNAVVGAFYNDDNGSAYVFNKIQGGADNWGWVTKLAASDGASGDRFGYSVAVSGDYALVGAPEDDDNGDSSGSAYIFYKDQGGAGNWGQAAKLTPSDGAADDEFGNSVSISGHYAVVGAFQNDDNGDHSGSAYIFRKDQGGTDKWGQCKKLIASDGVAWDEFGNSVSISGHYVIVGAKEKDGMTGSAYIFHKDQGGTDKWGQCKKLIASDGAIEDCFGRSVSISGDNAVVGAFYDNDNGASSGSAYIFFKDQGGIGNWGEVEKLTASDGAAGDHFGVSVAISDYFAVAGANCDDDDGDESGSAYIFKDFVVGSVLVIDYSDYNGDLSSDISIFRPSTGKWFIKNQYSCRFGMQDDIPTPGDYNGDSSADVAVFRPSSGKWFIRGQFSKVHGKNGDIPVPGDYDGDGDTDVAVFRSDTWDGKCRWFVSGQPVTIHGARGDKPVPGDYNGDGTMDVAVFRPSNGKWYIKLPGWSSKFFGMQSDTPVPADYDGDGATEIAVCRLVNDKLKWFVKGESEVIHGATGDIPVPGDYNGDGEVDIAVFRPSNGKWYVRLAGWSSKFFGMEGDIPLVRGK